MKDIKVLKGTLFKIPKRKPDVSNLKEIQEIIFQRNDLLEEFKKKHMEMKDTIEVASKAFYKEKLAELFLCEYIKSLAKDNTNKLPVKSLCTNNKDYLGSNFIYIMKVIKPLKEDSSFFAVLIDLLNKASNITEADKQALADELVYLFLTDFTSYTKSDHLFLSHIDSLLPLVLNKSSFSSKDFSNMILEAFIRKPEVVEYTKHVFGSTLNEILELSLRRADYKLDPKKITTEIHFNLIKNEEAKESSRSVLEDFKFLMIKSYIGEHSSDPSNNTEAEPIIEGMPLERIKKLIDNLLEVIKAQCEYVPLSLRFFFKLIESHVKNLYPEKNTYTLTKEFIVDFIFNRWWSILLLNPEEHGLIDICIIDQDLYKKIYVILYILKSIFLSAEDKSVTPRLNDYITSKKKYADHFICSLLSVTCPDFKEMQQNAITVYSTCISDKAIKIIQKVLALNMEAVKNYNEMYAKYVSNLERTFKQQIEEAGSNFDCAFVGDNIKCIEGLSEEVYGVNVEHYFTFQEIKFQEETQESVLPEKWQNILGELLLKIDLSSQCKLRMSSTESENRSEILDIMKEISKRPASYITTDDTANKISLLAYFMHDFFEQIDKDSIFDTLLEFKAKSRETIKNFKARIKGMTYEFGIINNALELLKNISKKRNKVLIDEVITYIVTSKLICSLPIPFEIYSELINPKKKEEWKYIILFSEGNILPKKSIHRHSVQVKKTKKFKKSPIHKGMSISNFTNALQELDSINTLVADNKDPHGIKDVYSSYIEHIKKILEEESLEEVKIKDFNKILLLIEDYIMCDIYARMFPIESSKADKEFKEQVKKLQENKLINCLISPEQTPKELLKLAVKKFESSSLMITPRQKLRNYREVNELIKEGLIMVDNDKDSSNACSDEQMYILIVLHSNMKRLISDINSIEYFTASSFNSEHRDILKKVRSAIKFLKEI